jgi:tRNA/tmRNA/rRNA uracil-C5-methylase (TrmA/RlmC/RlmD family)
MNKELSELQEKTDDLKDKMKSYITKTNLFSMIPSPKNTHYRNNIMFSIGRNSLGEIEVGPFETIKSKNVINASNNNLVSNLGIRICNYIKEYIIQESKLPVTEYPSFEGFWRHIHLRHNIKNELIMCFRFSNFEEHINQWKLEKYELINYLLSREKKYKFKLLKMEYQLCSGKSEPDKNSPYYHIFNISDLYEKIFYKNFRINMGSFFQVNMYSTKYIYSIVKKLIIPDAKINLYDLCCGVGMYSIILADKFSRVFGIDYNIENIRMANNNKKMNNVQNVKFINDRVENVFKDLIKSNPLNKTVIINPPRRGLYPSVLDELNNNMTYINQIIYVSCNSESLKNDLSKLNLNGKNVKHIIPINQFPNTKHYEVIVNIN